MLLKVEIFPFLYILGHMKGEVVTYLDKINVLFSSLICQNWCVRVNDNYNYIISVFYCILSVIHETLGQQKVEKKHQC